MKEVTAKPKLLDRLANALMTEQVIERLDKIEKQLALLVNGSAKQDWYDTNAVGEALGRSSYSVREWCRLGRVRAEKRMCGRGLAKEWMISHEELLRIKSEGLLPLL